MNGKHVTFAGMAVLAPLMASCAQQQGTRLLGPPVPAPLNMREAAEVVRGQVGAGEQLEWVGDLDDGQLFGVTSPAESRGGPFRESRLLFVHDSGAVLEWPGR